MKIPANSLEAFLAVARSGRFAKAATQLGIGQSALSQRILNLESQLETTLFVRDRAGSRLTPEGEELLRYAQTQESLEEEFLKRGSAELRGSLRVAGFSSITRSLLLPALAPLARAESVGISVLARELEVLPELLRRGEADLVVLDRESDRDGVEALFLGFEENVLVRGKRWRGGAEIYLDHDSEDLTTARYFQKFGQRAKKLERRFLDEVYALIDGVRLGYGLAVLPLHLVRHEKDLEIVEPSRILKIPVWLHFPAQAYYPLLQRRGRDEISTYAKARLIQK
ncbi:MAG: LysR family transcriptional regulator [Bdellovibrionota bacterium]